MALNIGMIGNGRVGSALSRGLTRAGYEVRAVGKDPKAVRETIQKSDAVILAVPFRALDDVVKTSGDVLSGKTVIDPTNALDAHMKLALGFTTSGAEELQKNLPNSRVVKAFNTVFAQHMDTGKLRGDALTALVAGNDAAAKKLVLELAGKIGFDPVDAGPLENARYLESLGYLNIQLGYALEMGPQIGFKLLHD